MTIQQLLAKLADLREREQKGEDVSAELAEAQGALDQIKAAATQPNTGGISEDERKELERLRSQAQESEEKATASQLVKKVMDQFHQDEAAKRQRIESYTAEAIKDFLGGEGDLSTAVEQVLKNQRSGSRFPGIGASDQVLDVLAAGGSIDAKGQLVTPDNKMPGLSVSGLSGVQIGEHQGVKAIEEEKNLAHFLSILSRSKSMGPMGLSEAEQLFLVKQFRQDLGEGKAQAQGTPSAGGFLVPEQWMPDILTPLRAAAVVRRANPRIIPFDKQMNQVSISSGTTAYYTAENARITPSELTAAQAALLTPKFLTALVPASNVLLGNWTNGDQFIRDDMTSAISTREDLSFLMGTGSGGEPKGLREIAGSIVNPLAPGANGFVPTMPQLRQIKGRTRMVATSNPRWTWFFNPAMLTYLETLVDTTGRFLIDAGILKINDDGVSGTFDGFPFYASYQIPTNLTLGTSTNVSFVLLVDMSQALVGEEQSLALAVSDQATYSPDGGTTHISAFQQNQTIFRAIMGHDINHRRPATGIIVQEGVRVG